MKKTTGRLGDISLCSSTSSPIFTWVFVIKYRIHWAVGGIFGFLDDKFAIASVYESTK